MIHSTKAVMDLVIRGGKTVEVTYHGVAKARIVPIAEVPAATGNSVEQAVRAGRAVPPGFLPLPSRDEPLRGTSGLTVDELLAEDRVARL